MRKLKLLSLLMLICFSVGNVFADSFTITLKSGTGTGDSSSGMTSTNVSDYVADGADFVSAVAATGKVYLAKSDCGIKFGNSSGGGSLTFTLTNAVSPTSIVVNASQFGASEGKGIFQGQEFDMTGGGGKYVFNDYTVNYDGNTEVTTISVGAEKRGYVKSITVNYGEGEPKTLSSIAISGTPTKTAYYVGDEFDPAGLVVTGTYSDQSQSTITSGITWSFNPAQALELGQTFIGVTATVGNISSEEYNVDVTVTEAPAAVNYEKIIAEPADWSGEYILVYEADATNARVWKGADQANNYAEATIANDVIAAPEEAAVLTIAKVAESDPVVYTIMVGDKYIGQTSDANGIKIQATAINNSISYNGTDAAVDIVASSAHLRYNSASSSYFRYYKSSSYSSQKKIQLYKKVEGAILPAAGLEYAAADQKKLTKLGDEFTAPTLINPNQLTVSYASNNTDVAEVAANGAVTIKAAGVAVITASFESDGSYKSGSASYTLGVTNHAGTEADPFDVADTKIAIDALETMENAYVSGMVSHVATTTLSADGFITFNISADGTSTGQQIQAYKCKSFNGEAFTAVGDVEDGATVVVTGNLMKYNSTYELDQNCYLVSYEAPAVQKQSIANDQAHPYTVAQAITFANDGVHYDLNDFVYVQGVVYNVKSFNSTNGTLDIYIKDANAENQFELYKCAGIYDGTSTAPTPFEALTDVQVGNIVIGYGLLTVFNNMSELKQGNYLVDLQAPATGIELDATAEVEAGSTVNLTATILPSNATGTIVWSVESGDTYASVENGVVTGIAEGEAVIRATVQGTAFYAECTVNVTPAVAPGTYDYALVTDAAQLQDGLKVIIVAAEADKAAGAAAATYREVVDVERTSNGNYLILDSENMPTEFTLGVLPAAGQYTFNDGDGYMYESAAKSVKVQENPFAWSITIGDGNIATISAVTTNNALKYNSGSPRFTTYASGQQALQLFIKDDGKQAAGLAWSTDAVVLTVGDEFTAPTLTNPNNLTVTIESNNTELATVENNVVSLVANVTGTAKITASFAGDDTYRAASVSYTITVSAAPQPASTDNVVILASFNNKLYAMSNTIDNKSCVPVEVEEDGANIIVPSAEAKVAIQWTKDFNGTTATFQDANSKYLKGTSGGGDLTLVDDEFNWTWDESTDYHCFVVGTRSFIFRGSTYNIFKNYAISNVTDPNNTQYAGVEIRVIDPENIIVTTKVDPELAFDPASVILTVGDNFTAPVLSYADNFDGLAAVTYESSNPDLATVEGGVVSLVADATGTATITANFPGNANYLSGSASYTITVNEAGDDLSGTWTRVTAVAAGQKIIIAGTYNEKTMAMGKQNSNNRAAVVSTLDGTTLTPGSATKVFTLVDAGEGLFAIQASNGKYLNAAGTGSSNYLREADDFEAASAKWTITFDENGANIVATSTGNRNVIRYNSTNNSELFSCYAAGTQRAINIYSNSAAPEPPVEDWTDVRTGLTSDHYYTICLEKEMTNIKGATLWSFIGKDDNFAYLVKEEAPFEAGKPYIMHTTASTVQAVLTGDDAEDAGSNNGLYGTFVYMNADALSAVGADYMLYENALHPIGTNNHLDANRAYVILNNIQGGTPGQMPGRQIRRMPMQPAVATGFENVEASENPMKLMINGQMYILRGEKLYDATGRLVK